MIGLKPADKVTPHWNTKSERRTSIRVMIAKDPNANVSCFFVAEAATCVSRRPKTILTNFAKLNTTLISSALLVKKFSNCARLSKADFMN